MEIEVRGARELEALSKRLKATGNGDLRKEMLKGIREATKPTIRDIKASASEKLPHRGGLADKVAASKIGARTRATGKNAGVRIEAKNAYNVRRMNAGRLRHPVFGNRENWVTQEVEPGWFSEPISKNLPGIRRGVMTAMEDVAKKVEG